MSDYYYRDTVKVKGKTVEVKVSKSTKGVYVNGRDTGYTYKHDTGYYYRAGSRVTNDLMMLLNMIV